MNKQEFDDYMIRRLPQIPINYCNRCIKKMKFNYKTKRWECKYCDYIYIESKRI